jgi:hypothetical protein
MNQAHVLIFFCGKRRRVVNKNNQGQHVASMLAWGPDADPALLQSTLHPGFAESADAPNDPSMGCV